MLPISGEVLEPPMNEFLHKLLQAMLDQLFEESSQIAVEFV